MDCTNFINLVNYINADKMDNLIYTIKYILTKTSFLKIPEIFDRYVKLNIFTIIKHHFRETVYDYKIYYPQEILHELLKIRMRMFIIFCLNYFEKPVPFSNDMSKYSNYLDNIFNTEQEKNSLYLNTKKDCYFLQSQEVGEIDPLTIWNEELQ